MANDVALRSALVWLAAVVVVVGICTFSFKKMIATYAVGILGISGLLLPDWGHFDRDFSRWSSPVASHERVSEIALRSWFSRFLILSSVFLFIQIYAKLLISYFALLALSKCRERTQINGNLI